MRDSGRVHLDFFDRVSVVDYHLALFTTWTRLVKDGIVRKDDTELATRMGSMFVSEIYAQRGIPSYEAVLGWVSNQY